MFGTLLRNDIPEDTATNSSIQEEMEKSVYTIQTDVICPRSARAYLMW